jgi:hypothetical protein
MSDSHPIPPIQRFERRKNASQKPTRKGWQRQLPAKSHQIPPIMCPAHFKAIVATKEHKEHRTEGRDLIPILCALCAFSWPFFHPPLQRKSHRITPGFDRAARTAPGQARKEHPTSNANRFAPLSGQAHGASSRGYPLSTIRYPPPRRNHTESHPSHQLTSTRDFGVRLHPICVSEKCKFCQTNPILP